MKSTWCEHLDKRSKYTNVSYHVEGGQVVLKVQTWYCPECGVHGADAEIVKPNCDGVSQARSA